FDGIAYGSLLFLVSVGLSVTMGLMNFVNLAHGAFAMAGGFACAVAMNRFGMPFLATLPLAFLLGAAIGAILERALYRRLYRASHLDQVLFSIGLTFMAVAAATWVFGSSQQLVRLPDALRGQVRVAGVDFGIYRLFLVAMVAAITAVLGVLVARTRFGAQVRAAVDDAEAARVSRAEAAFWIVPVAAFFLLPGYLVLGSQILIVALFALSLDLILGYAGILSLGHAAFFGLGAYTAGLLAVHGWSEPLSGLAAAMLVAGMAGFAASFLVVRGDDLTRLMVTMGIGLLLYEAANRARSITGG